MANPTAEPTKCVIYSRCSTGKQAESGLGLEAQLEQCKRVALAKGLEIIGVESDPGVSGSDALADRPGLQRVLELAPKGSDVAVVAYSLSRVAQIGRAHV